MPRATNAPASRARRKRVIDASKGYRGRRSKLFRYAKVLSTLGGFSPKGKEKRKTAPPPGRFAASGAARIARRTVSASSRSGRPLASALRPPRPRAPNRIGSKSDRFSPACG